MPETPSMRDGCGRAVEYLRLSVTDRCNCRCTYCMPAGGVPALAHDDICGFEELVEIVRALASLGVRKVRLTGGEPLVRRGIVDLVRMLREVPGIEELDLTTNATLLAPLAAPLRAAGVDRINVSLDSLDPERYAAITRGGRLADALAGLAAARDAGFSGTKINCVLMGGVNDDEIPRLAGLAREHPVDVRFIELMPIGEAASWPRASFLGAGVVLERVPGLERAGAQGVAELYRGPGWAGRVGLIRPMSHRFCDACTRVRVTSDGRLKPCLHSADEVSLRGLSGEALVAEIVRGIGLKPAHHDMDEAHASRSARAMNEIGG